MAYIGKASIKCYSHMENAIGYIAKQEKAMPLSQMKKYLEESFSHIKSVDTALGERTTFINCIPQTAYMEFEIRSRAVISNSSSTIWHLTERVLKTGNRCRERQRFTT